MKGASFKDNTWARICLAVGGHVKKPKSRITVHMLGPKYNANIMAKGIKGNVKNISVNRIRASSMMPP